MNRIAMARALALLGPALLVLSLPAQRGGSREEVWKFLKTQYDGNGDGKVTPEEYPRGERQFRNLDRNEDGVLDEEDFPRRRQGEGAREGRGPRDRGGDSERRPPRVPDDQLARRLGEMYGSFLDVDGEPGLSKADWDALLARLEPDEEGVIAAERLRAITGAAGRGRMARMIRRMPRMFDRDDDGKVTVGDLETAFGTMDEDGDGVVEQGDEIELPPGVGQPAPDFTLPFADDAGKEVTLSGFRGEKPVALIFGSYT